MQIEICTWSQPGANFKNLHMVQILHTCANLFTWTDLHTSVYMQIFAHICKSVHVNAPLNCHEEQGDLGHVLEKPVLDLEELGHVLGELPLL